MLLFDMPILSPLRLPVPPSRQGWLEFKVSHSVDLQGQCRKWMPVNGRLWAYGTPFVSARHFVL
jgi:hypothetical protein